MSRFRSLLFLSKAIIFLNSQQAKKLLSSRQIFRYAVYRLVPSQKSTAEDTPVWHVSTVEHTIKGSS